MTSVAVDELRRLDMRPQPAPLAEGLEPIWSWHYPAGHRRRSLYQWHTQLLYLDDAGVGAVERQLADGALDSPGAYHRLAIEAIGGSLHRGPLVLGRSGELRQWDHGELIGPLTHPESPQNAGWRGAAVTGLEEGMLLVRRFDPASTELVELGRRRLWQRDGCALAVVAFGDRLVEMDGLDRTAVHMRYRSSGDLEWTMSAGTRVEQLIAVVDDRVWLAVAGDRLMALGLGSGHVQVDRGVPGVGLTGTVTADGRYVLCSGYDVLIIDLAGDGQVTEHRFVNGEHAAGGAFARVAADGRIVFTDQRHRIWVIEADDPRRPRLLATADGLVTGFQINNGSLYVLTEHGTLTAYGVPDS